MTIGKFIASMKDVEKLLVSLKFSESSLLKQRGVKSIISDGMSKEFLNEMYGENYVKLYMAGKSNFDYDFLLIDESYLQFGFSTSKNGELLSCRYSFMHNPLKFVTYKEYLENSGYSIEVGDMFMEDYEQSNLELELKPGILPIRYEYNISQYSPLFHPASHLHFGHLADIRIPIDKILTPLEFVYFIVRHSYLDYWTLLCNVHDSKQVSKLAKIKHECNKVPSKYWNRNLDGNELYLS